MQMTVRLFLVLAALVAFTTVGVYLFYLFVRVVFPH